MSTALRDENEEARNRWARNRVDTVAVVLEMKNYYGDTARKSKTAVIRQAKEDGKKIQTCLMECYVTSAKVATTSGTLRAQGENCVVKMEKHGQKSAALFTGLGAILSALCEHKFEELKNRLDIGKVAAAGVALIVGAFCSGCVALVVYDGMMKQAQAKEKLRKEMENKDQQGNEGSLVQPKRTCLSEIRNLLRDLEEDNFDPTVKQLMIEINNYLEDN